MSSQGPTPAAQLARFNVSPARRRKDRIARVVVVRAARTGAPNSPAQSAPPAIAGAAGV